MHYIYVHLKTQVIVKYHDLANDISNKEHSRKSISVLSTPLILLTNNPLFHSLLGSYLLVCNLNSVHGHDMTIRVLPEHVWPRYCTSSTLTSNQVLLLYVKANNTETLYYIRCFWIASLGSGRRGIPSYFRRYDLIISLLWKYMAIPTLESVILR